MKFENQCVSLPDQHASHQLTAETTLRLRALNDEWNKLSAQSSPPPPQEIPQQPQSWLSPAISYAAFTYPATAHVLRCTDAQRPSSKDGILPAVSSAVLSLTWSPSPPGEEAWSQLGESGGWNQKRHRVPTEPRKPAQGAAASLLRHRAAAARFLSVPCLSSAPPPHLSLRPQERRGPLDESQRTQLLQLCSQCCPQARCSSPSPHLLPGWTALTKPLQIWSVF